MIGDKTFQQLSHLGLKQVSHIQKTPLEAMSVLGKNGNIIWKRANGIDNRPIVEFHERKSISNERTFGKDTTDITKLKTCLSAMTENLAYQLRKGEKVTSCISVKIRYSDFNTYSKQLKIPYTSADYVLIPKIMELFDKLYDKRLLIRLVGVRFSDLCNGSYQMSLFEDTKKTADLYLAMDNIRNRYGSRSVMRANTLGAKTIGSNFNPFDGEPPIVLAHRTR